VQKELEADKENTLWQTEVTVADEHRYHQEATNALQGRIQALEASAVIDLASSRSEKDALRKECEARDDELKTLKDMLSDVKQVSFVSTKPMSEYSWGLEHDV
jgi:hypothetical protein